MYMKDKKRLTNKELKQSIWRNQEKIVDNLLDIKHWENYQSEKDDNIPSEQMYNKVKTEINKDTISQFDKRDKKYKIYSLIKYTATACLMLFFSWVFYQQLNIKTIKNTNLSANYSLPVTNEEIWITQFNTTQEIKWIYLPDSSRVKLYPSSEISYPEVFSAINRDIRLSGKAYFKVTKDASRPFSVWSDYTKTTALGTSFTIDAFPNKQNTTVTLHTGKIVIKSVKEDSKFDEIYMSENGEKLIFNSATHHLSHINPISINKNNQIENVSEEYASAVVKMDKISLPEAVNILSRLYKTKIVIENKSLDHITYTGSVDTRTENLEDALEVICLINNLEWRRTQNGIYHIYKNKNHQN
jgi:transmembrane sensor